jgi:hypothetical protein
MNPIRALYDRLPETTRSSIRDWLPDDFLRWYARQNTDTYLISYPKCGRTWLRLMLGRAICTHFGLPEDEDMLLLNWRTRPQPAGGPAARQNGATIPMIRAVHDDRPMLRTPDELETSKQQYRGKKVIFLARDPRDVVISSYFEMTNRGRLFGENPYEQQQAVFEGTLGEFIQQPRGGFDTIIRYYTIWAQNREVPSGFLLLRYEDLKANAPAELRKALDFLGLQEVSDFAIAEAVAFAAFDNMRKMEAEGRFKSAILRPGNQANQNSFKTRKGKVQGYLEYLSPEEVTVLNQKMHTGLPELYGYY